MGGGTRTRAVMDDIRRRIGIREVAPGERLPSIRGFARSLRVSPSTVVEAYDRLAAEGLITPRRGSGFYVASAPTPFVVADVGPRLERQIDPLWVARQALEADPDLPMPGCGWLPSAWLPQETLRRAVRKLARSSDETLAGYGAIRGGGELRRLIARQAAQEGLPIDSQQCLLTGSGTQSIDLVCRMLMRPDETVIVDDPCYFNFLSLLRAHRARVIGVPYTAAGPDLEAFAHAIEAHKPRLYITNSALQNPTGAAVSAATAHRLLKMTSAHGVVIVEDDIFSALEPEPSPRLAVLDGLESVIRIGSFSKTLSASIRCGYVVAKHAWIEAMVDLQVATNFGGPSPMAVQIVHDTLSAGGHRKHIGELKRRLARAQRMASARLSRLGIVPVSPARGGFFLWCRLPGELDASEVAKAALAQGMVLAPGNVFSVSRTAADMMRFNVAHMSDPRTYEVLQQAMRAACV